MSLYAKCVSFWANEGIVKYSDKLMLCKLWGKMASVFVNISFVAKMLDLGKTKKKKINFRRNVDFSHAVCTTTESNNVFAKHAYF